MINEYSDRLEKLLNQLKGQNRIEAHQTDELFALHNHFYPQHQEHGKSCSVCRNRVYNRLKKLGKI